jgi:hypothetical protein
MRANFVGQSTRILFCCRMCCFSIVSQSQKEKKNRLNARASLRQMNAVTILNSDTTKSHRGPVVGVRVRPILQVAMNVF